jgi:hypothetical protein
MGDWGGREDRIAAKMILSNSQRAAIAHVHKGSGFLNHHEAVAMKAQCMGFRGSLWWLYAECNMDHGSPRYYKDALEPLAGLLPNQ